MLQEFEVEAQSSRIPGTKSVRCRACQGCHNGGAEKNR